MVVPFPPTMYQLYESYTSFISGDKVNYKGAKEKWHIEQKIFDKGEADDFLNADDFK